MWCSIYTAFAIHLSWIYVMTYLSQRLPTNVISDLSNICLLAKYSQIHDFIQCKGTPSTNGDLTHMISMIMQTFRPFFFS